MSEQLYGAAARKQRRADFSRLAPTVATFSYVQIAAETFSKWSRSSDRDKFLCFQSYEKLETDSERHLYLVARLAAIRDAHGAEFIKRTPKYCHGGDFQPRDLP